MRLNSVKQHIAAFHSGPTPQAAEFVTTSELLAVPFVAQWATETDGKVFHQFSISDGRRLMAEYDRGRSWWVIGFLDHADGVDLPVWVPVREEEAAATA